MHVVAGKAVCFEEAKTPAFKDYARQVVANAKAFSEGLLEHGFDLVSGGTDNHLILVDLQSKGVTGKKAEAVLERAGITANKNAVPFDPQKPFITSGVRFGTAALTTRGFRESEMQEIARLVAGVLDDPENEDVVNGALARTTDMSRGFPLYPDLN